MGEEEEEEERHAGKRVESRKGLTRMREITGGNESEKSRIIVYGGNDKCARCKGRQGGGGGRGGESHKSLER